MSEGDDEMSEMKPVKRKGSLIEKADGRFDFGGQLRRIEPSKLDETLGNGPVIEARPAKRKPVPKMSPRRSAPPAETAAVSSAPPAAAASVQPDASPPVPATAEGPAPATPAVPVTRTSGAIARRRFVPRAPKQPINRQLLADLGMALGESSISPLGEEYRLIKRQLLRNAAGQAHGRRILISSAQPAEGKTFSAINLALSLAAEHDLSVLLVDGDFARREVTSRLGIVPGPGLLDVLSDPTVDLADCVIPTDIPELSILPAGAINPRETELLNSARMRDVLETLEADAPDRIILFDSMPLLAASSAGVIAQLCGQVVVVVRADVTLESVLRDAIGLIGQHGGISLLLNRVRFTPEGRRFGSYYGEGG